MIAIDVKENLHVHLVRSRFVLFLWEAAQYDGPDGPLQEIERFYLKICDTSFLSNVLHKNIRTIDCI